MSSTASQKKSASGPSPPSFLGCVVVLISEGAPQRQRFIKIGLAPFGTRGQPCTNGSILTPQCNCFLKARVKTE